MRRAGLQQDANLARRLDNTISSGLGGGDTRDDGANGKALHDRDDKPKGPNVGALDDKSVDGVSPRPVLSELERPAPHWYGCYSFSFFSRGGQLTDLQIQVLTWR